MPHYPVTAPKPTPTERFATKGLRPDFGFGHQNAFAYLRNETGRRAKETILFTCFVALGTKHRLAIELEPAFLQR